MARIPANLFEQWQNGITMTAEEYNRQLEIIRVAINDFDEDVKLISAQKVGPEGPMGPTGPAGPQGLQGIQGIKGDKGDKGIQGPVGPQGLQGIQGPIGPVGPQGPKGDTGPTGPQGPQGPKGDKGDPGTGNVDTVNGKVGPNITLIASDVGAIPATEKGTANGVAKLNAAGKVVDASGNEVEGKVTSVNGQTGDVVISTFSGDYTDLVNKPSIPTTTSQLTNDSGFVTENTLNEHLADEAAHGIGDKTTLLTTDKTSVVNAINEVFQSGNNVKSDMVAALLAVDPTLPITVNSSWEEIETATGQISTGKKWARMTVTSPSSTNWTISGLPFSPSKLRLTLQTPSSTHAFSVINIDFVDKIAYFNGSVLRTNTIINRQYNGTNYVDWTQVSVQKTDGVFIPGGYLSSAVYELEAYE